MRPFIVAILVLVASPIQAQKYCGYYRSPTGYAPYVAPVYTPFNWRQSLINSHYALVKQRDAWEGKMRLDAADHAAFMQEWDKLGMDRLTQEWPGYGLAGLYGAQSLFTPYEAHVAALTGQPATQQGHTLIGIETTTYTGNVNLDNMNAGYAGLLARDSEGYKQNLGQFGQHVRATNQEMLALNSQVLEKERIRAESDGEVAKIKARADGLRGDPTFTRKTETYENRPDPQVTIERHLLAPQQQPGVQTLQAPQPAGLVGIVNRNCLECHSPAKASGGLDLSDLSKLTKEQTDAVLLRITLAESDKDHMPKGRPQLSAAEQLEFFKAATFGTK